MRVRAVGTVLVLVLAGACGRAEHRSAEQQGSAAATRPQSAAPVGTDKMQLRASDRELNGFAGAARSAEPAAGQIDLDAADPMLIRSGRASIEVDSLEPMLESLQATARRLGGYFAGTTLRGGREEYREATVEVKVATERFDDLLLGLRSLGRLETVQVTAEDVGEEFVDLTARVANARRLEDRLLELVSTRTGRLKDIVELERELARVRQEIERYEGRLRYLRTRSAMSTLAVTLHEPPPIIGERPGVLARAFEQAWRNFVGLLAAFIASLGILVPLALTGSAVVLGIRHLRKA